MSSYQNIMCVAYFRRKDGLVLAQHSSASDFAGLEKLFEILSKGIARDNHSIICTESDESEQQKLHIITEDIDGVAVLAHQDYPPEAAAELLAALRADIQRLIPEEAVAAAEEAQVLSPVLEADMKKRCMIYDNPSEAGKIAEVVQKVEEVRIVMEHNIDKILDQSEDIRVVECKGDQLVTNTTTFQKSSEELKRIIWRRNMKIKVITGVVGATVVLYIVIPLAVNFT